MDIEKLKRLCNEATPGPWTAGVMLQTILPKANKHFSSLTFTYSDDAAFIAASRTAIPELIARIEMLEAKCAKYKALVTEAFGSKCEDFEPDCACCVCGRNWKGWSAGSDGKMRR